MEGGLGIGERRGWRCQQRSGVEVRVLAGGERDGGSREGESGGERIKGENLCSRLAAPPSQLHRTRVVRLIINMTLSNKMNVHYYVDRQSRRLEILLKSKIFLQCLRRFKMKRKRTTSIGVIVTELSRNHK